MTEETTTNQVSKEFRISSYDDIMDANAALMSDTMNDRRMTTAEKMKNLNLGCRNVAIINGDRMRRRAEIVRFGAKPNGNINALNFNPMADDAA